MLILVAGLALFLGVHSFSTFRAARAGAVARLGPGPYKGLYDRQRLGRGTQTGYSRGAQEG